MVESKQPVPSVVAGLVFCLVVAAAVRFSIVWGMDLRGAFGPDAPGAAASALLGPFTHPYPLHPLAISLLTPLAGGDPVPAALVLSLVAGLAMVAAIWAMARMLGGEHAGRAAGAVAACTPLLVYPSLLGGGDAPAMAVAWWGLALAWRGARGRWRQAAWGSDVAGHGQVLALVGGVWLIGLSAAFKPIALPSAIYLVLVPVLGGRWTLKWLGVGGALALVTAWPFLGPLVAPDPTLGLLGSWWQPVVPSTPLDCWTCLVGGVTRLAQADQGSSWILGLPLLVLAVFGGVGRGQVRRERLALLALGSLALVLVAGMLGDRFRPRYVASGLVGWVVLAGFAVTPLRHWRWSSAAAASPLQRTSFLETLPMSLVMTLFIMSSLRFWDGMGLLRTQEEGAAPPRGLVAGWAEDFRPQDAYLDASICGALELQRWADDWVDTLPSSGTVLVVPLRDGREWHLVGELRVRRPDLEVIILSQECCPHPLSECAERIPVALAQTGGGAVIAPLNPEGRCETGAVGPVGAEWTSALVPHLVERRFWYGATMVEPVADDGQLCEYLGGRRPEVPAPAGFAQPLSQPRSQRPCGVRGYPATIVAARW